MFDKLWLLSQILELLWKKKHDESVPVFGQVSQHERFKILKSLIEIESELEWEFENIYNNIGSHGDVVFLGLQGRLTPYGQHVR